MKRLIDARQKPAREFVSPLCRATLASSPMWRTTGIEVDAMNVRPVNEQRG